MANHQLTNPRIDPIMIKLFTKVLESGYLTLQDFVRVQCYILRVPFKIEKALIYSVIKLRGLRRYELWKYLLAHGSRKDGLQDLSSNPQELTLKERYTIISEKFRYHRESYVECMKSISSESPLPSHGQFGEILRDVVRTFQTQVFFQPGINGAGEIMLQNILRAIVIVRPDIGYCQGMNFVCGMLLLAYLDSSVVAGLTHIIQKDGSIAHAQLMPNHIPSTTINASSDSSDAVCRPPDRTFSGSKRSTDRFNDHPEYALSDAIISQAEASEAEAEIFAMMMVLSDKEEKFAMSNLWCPGVPKMKLRVYQMDRLLQWNLPQLHEHFRNINLAPEILVAQWFVTIFSYTIPQELTLRLWDYIFYGGWPGMFRIGLSLLYALEPQLLGNDLEGVSLLMKDWKKTGVMAFHSSYDEVLRRADLVVVNEEVLQRLQESYALEMISISEASLARHGRNLNSIISGEAQPPTVASASASASSASGNGSTTSSFTDNSPSNTSAATASALSTTTSTSSSIYGFFSRQPLSLSGSGSSRDEDRKSMMLQMASETTNWLMRYGDAVDDRVALEMLKIRDDLLLLEKQMDHDKQRLQAKILMACESCANAAEDVQLRSEDAKEWTVRVGLLEKELKAAIDRAQYVAQRIVELNESATSPREQTSLPESTTEPYLKGSIAVGINDSVDSIEPLTVETQRNSKGTYSDLNIDDEDLEDTIDSLSENGIGDLQREIDIESPDHSFASAANDRSPAADPPPPTLPAYNESPGVTQRRRSSAAAMLSFAAAAAAVAPATPIASQQQLPSSSTKRIHSPPLSASAASAIGFASTETVDEEGHTGSLTPISQQFFSLSSQSAPASATSGSKPSTTGGIINSLFARSSRSSPSIPGSGSALVSVPGSTSPPLMPSTQTTRRSSSDRGADSQCLNPNSLPSDAEPLQINTTFTESADSLSYKGHEPHVDVITPAFPNTSSDFADGDCISADVRDYRPQPHLRSDSITERVRYIFPIFGSSSSSSLHAESAAVADDHNSQSPAVEAEGSDFSPLPVRPPTSSDSATAAAAAASVETAALPASQHRSSSSFLNLKKFTALRSPFRLYRDSATPQVDAATTAGNVNSISDISTTTRNEQSEPNSCNEVTTHSTDSTGRTPISTFRHLFRGRQEEAATPASSCPSPTDNRRTADASGSVVADSAEATASSLPYVEAAATSLDQHNSSFTSLFIHTIGSLAAHIPHNLSSTSPAVGGAKPGQSHRDGRSLASNQSSYNSHSQVRGHGSNSTSNTNTNTNTNTNAAVSDWPYLFALGTGSSPADLEMRNLVFESQSCQHLIVDIHGMLHEARERLVATQVSLENAKVTLEEASEWKKCLCDQLQLIVEDNNRGRQLKLQHLTDSFMM